MDFCLVLQLMLLTISFGVPGTLAQCKKGEPTNDSEEKVPDLNITLSGTIFRVGDKLNITCVADRPRFASQRQSNDPGRPSEITAFLDGSNQPACSIPLGVQPIVCVRTVLLTKAATNASALCFAKNNNGCRTKAILFTILEKSIETTSAESSPASTSIFTSSSTALNTDISSIESSPVSQMSVFGSPSTTTNTGGTGGKQDAEDDDEVDDVKKLITATLILVIITLVLMVVAIVFVLRTLYERKH